MLMNLISPESRFHRQHFCRCICLSPFCMVWWAAKFNRSR